MVGIPLDSGSTEAFCEDCRGSLAGGISGKGASRSELESRNCGNCEPLSRTIRSNLPEQFDLGSSIEKLTEGIEDACGDPRLRAGWLRELFRF